MCCKYPAQKYQLQDSVPTTPPALPSESVSALACSTMWPAATEARITSLAAGWQPTTVMSRLTDLSSAAIPAYIMGHCKQSV